MNGEIDAAVEFLERASRRDVLMPEAGWLLADVLAIRSWPPNAPAPDRRLLSQARDWWESWASYVGQPTGPHSWAYLTRASIESAVTGPDTAAAFWRSLLLVEKCLATEQENGNAWAMSASYLRSLSLQALAAEAADAGFHIDPDNKLVLTVRYSLLADAGHYEEAIQMLDRTPDRDVGAAADYAWLLFHLGRAADAIHYLEEPISLGINKDQNLIVRALCYASIGQSEEALRDLADVLEVPDSDPYSGYRKAYANAGLGNVYVAQRELQNLVATPDEMVTSSCSHAVQACVQFAKGALDPASTELNAALAVASTVTDFDNTVINCTQLLKLLQYRGIDVKASYQVLQQAIEANPRTSMLYDAAEELSRCFDAHSRDPSDSAPLVSLRAIQARRLAQVGDLAKAAHAYGQLRSGVFGLQASAALVGVLARQLDYAVKSRELDRVRQLFDQLSELNARPYPMVELALAQAESAAGNLDSALAIFRQIDDTTLSNDWKVAVRRRIGELALQTGDNPAATDAFRSALAAASDTGRPDRAAQIEARIGISLLAQGDRQGTTSHFAGAIRLWLAAGALDPILALDHEVRAVTGIPDSTTWAETLADAIVDAAQQAKAHPDTVSASFELPHGA